MKHESIAHTLTADVGAGASFTVSYPAGRSADDYLGGSDHFIISDTIRTLFASSGDFSVVFGASNITVTLATGVALPDGAVLYLNVDRAERDDATTLANTAKMAELTAVKISLGKPATADPNGYVESQDLTAAGVFSVHATVAAALAAAALDGVADVPRNVVAGWTGAAVLTVTGTDEYGNVLVESSASGTSFAGKKAFKTVTGISVSANVTSLTVGTGDVLGLPCFIADAADVIRELQDDAVPTAGTIVAGSNATPTATTGDVRGTYDPNSACNGSLDFKLVALVRSASYKGLAQYAG